jgi:hypothetical protein
MTTAATVSLEEALERASVPTRSRWLSEARWIRRQLGDAGYRLDSWLQALGVHSGTGAVMLVDVAALRQSGRRQWQEAA